MCNKVSCILKLGIAFQVATSLESSQNPVQFKTVLVNFGNAYDSSQNRLCTAKKGFYWFHFDTFSDDYLNVNYKMIYDEVSNFAIGVVKIGTSDKEIDVLSLDDLANFETMTCLQMTSLYATTQYTSSLYMMTWAGFFIDSKVAFNLANNEASLSNSMKTNFSIIILNSGNCISCKVITQ